MPRARRAVSERASWDEVLAIVSEVRRIALGPSGRIDAGMIANRIDRIQYIADDMLDQLRQGIHENPPVALITWGNPKGRDSHVLSHRVYSIAYKHVEDGQDYEHPFAPGVTMFLHAKDHSVSLYRPDGKPVARDF